MSHFEATKNIAEAAVQTVIRESQVAFHGLLAAVAATRQENAVQITERMEHKIELYDALGTLAIKGTRPDTDIRPRTIVEKFVDWRMDRKAAKQIYADNETYLDRKTFGPDHSDFGASVRQAIRDRALSVPFRDHDVEEGILPAVVKNTKAVFVGPELEKGTTPLAKVIERTKNNALFLVGNKTAAERRQDQHKIMATPPKYGNKSYRRTRRAHRHANEQLENIVEMPISSRWRQRRLDKAEERIERMDQKIKRHRTAIQDLRK